MTGVFLIGFAILFGILTMFLWGIADFLYAFTSRKIGHKNATFYIFVVMAIGVILLIYMHQRLNLDNMDLLLIMILGITGVFAAMSFAKGSELGSLFIVSPVASTWAVLTVALSVIILGEKLAYIQILGIGMIVCGVVLESFNPRDIIKLKLSRKNMVVGVEYGIFAALLWGIFSFFLGLLIYRIGIFPAGVLYVIPSLVISAVIAGSVKRRSRKVDKSRIWILAILVAGLASLIGNFTFGAGITRNYIAVVAPIASAAPAVTIALAMFIFKERPTYNQYIGAIAILLGIIAISI